MAGCHVKLPTAVAAFIFAMSTLSHSNELPAEVTVRLLGPDGQPAAPTTVPTVKKTDAEWLTQLGADRYRILRSSGTEVPFCGTLLDNKKTGVYLCAGCELPLFASNAKFHSGTGWPSFFQPFAKENVVEITDESHGMTRTEIRCARCGGHLGHVFPDGPKPTGRRFCLNSEALVFTETK
jgi:methionine-R-sulfoxide reductase